MSEDKKEEVTSEEAEVDNESETITYSESFEKYEKAQWSDDNAKLFFGMLKEMSAEYQDDQSEKTRKLFSGVDEFQKNMKKALSTQDGRDLFKQELARRVGGKK